METTSIGAAVDNKALVILVPGYFREIVVVGCEQAKKIEVLALGPRPRKENTPPIVLFSGSGTGKFKQTIKLYGPEQMKPTGSWAAVLRADDKDVCRFQLRVIDRRMARAAGF